MLYFDFRPEVPFNLTATLDGDAKFGWRQSSDDGTLSYMDMDHSEYLNKGYQSSTPMLPGTTFQCFSNVIAS